MDVEFSREAHGPVVTTVHMADLEPIIRDPDVEGAFLYQQDGYTWTLYREHEKEAENINQAELMARAAVAWYVYLVNGGNYAT